MFKQGEKSDRVSAVQAMLGVLGYDPGPLDDTFGPRTKAALERFIADYRSEQAPGNSKEDCLGRQGAC